MRCPQTNNTQKMNNSEMIKQNTHNLHVCSMENIRSKRIKADKRKSHIFSTNKSESKRVIVNVCSLDESESKSVHISLNASQVKDAINETKYE